MNDLSAKVFRTYNASTVLERQLDVKANEQSVKADTDVNSKVKFYNDCNRDVALLCNHKKAAAKGLKEKLEQIEATI
jgi:DNA topoisomerase I